MNTKQALIAGIICWVMFTALLAMAIAWEQKWLGIIAVVGFVPAALGFVMGAAHLADQR